MIANASAEILEQGFKMDQIRHELYLNMSYEGSDTSLMILKPESQDFAAQFKKRHRREFNFTSDRPILVDDIRVLTIASSKVRSEKSPLQQLKEVSLRDVASPPAHSTQVYFDTAVKMRIDSPVYLLSTIEKHSRINGPAIIIDKTQTIVVTPNSTAYILDTCVLIDLQDRMTSIPINSCLWLNKWEILRKKTSVSTNIKERLDFSCALFSPDGGLVAHAPHVPVHLGSMQFTVRYQHQKWLGNLKDGDVLVANHPSCGGTHLPDVTVITPVFDRPGGSKIIFYVASRGHHADIGGILPGSMPPKSTELWQEGAAIKGGKIVSDGIFNEERMTELFLHKPSQYQGCSGTRCLSDNISDLKAQIAANARGISLIQNLIQEYGLDTVQRYMYAIQTTAESAVRDLLKGLFSRFGGEPLEAIDYMDDGSAIKLKITIDGEQGSAVFDFAGTGPEVYGNWNAPIAITHSAIIYSLWCMINLDIPLNQGCLTPIDIRIPPKSLLSPSKTAAVVGGNVMTSQRITDVVLKAFRACAASQGCVNNLTFGKDSTIDPHTGNISPGFGYYETMAGGSGAGPTWNGESGVHVHMTNTRITDPEFFEKRYPVFLRQFSLRGNSGGKGLHPGGEGVIREIEFLCPLQCSILSERRVHRPYGLEGGEDGEAGLNLWIKKDDENGEERKVNIGGKNTVTVKANDRVVIMTPGGGGWGKQAKTV